MPTVTLTTDFGTADGYAGEVKGVVLARCPAALPVDISHDVPPGDIRTGAWVLWRIWERYPPGTVHLAVVDPGVGSDRRPLAALAGRRWFVGPDNGLLTLVAREREVVEARRLDPGRVGLARVSDTFHGRDLFAPAAAHLAAGGDPREVGPEVDPSGLVLLRVPRPRRAGSEVRGEVAHVDRFGNLVTNIPADWVPAGAAVWVGEREVTVRGRAFADVEPGELVLIHGSVGTLEIAARDASAAERLGVGRGAEVRVAPLA